MMLTMAIKPRNSPKSSEAIQRRLLGYPMIRLSYPGPFTFAPTKSGQMRSGKETIVGSRAGNDVYRILIFITFMHDDFV